MSRWGISRRDVLRGIGLGTVGVAGTTTASAHSDTTRYIVGVSSTRGLGAARSAADSVHRVLDFGAFGRAVAGRFSDQALARLQERADVRYVEVDGRVHAIHHRKGHDGGPGNDDGSGGGGGSTSQRLPWGIDRVDAEVAHADGATGSGAHVAIIDTGIDDDHPDLQANLGEGRSFVGCRGKNCNYSWSDDANHGTHCAGIAGAVDNARGVVGVAPGVTLHAVKVLDKRGSGWLSDVAAGIQFVGDKGWDVGSLSLGAPSGSQTLRDACDYASSRGVLLVAAAGNSGPCSDCVGYPAAYDSVLAVGATDSDDTLAAFSSTGSAVEIAAPGVGIESTVVGGYDTYSGTSMACPHVSGAAAQLMATGTSSTDARSALLASAESIGLSASEGGAGLLDVAAALGYDSSNST